MQGYICNALILNAMNFIPLLCMKSGKLFMCETSLLILFSNLSCIKFSFNWNTFCSWWMKD